MCVRSRSELTDYENHVVAIIIDIVVSLRGSRAAAAVAASSPRRFAGQTLCLPTDCRPPHTATTNTSTARSEQTTSAALCVCSLGSFLPLAAVAQSAVRVTDPRTHTQVLGYLGSLFRVSSAVLSKERWRRGAIPRTVFSVSPVNGDCCVVEKPCSPVAWLLGDSRNVVGDRILLLRNKCESGELA